MILTALALPFAGCGYTGEAWRPVVSGVHISEFTVKGLIMRQPIHVTTDSAEDKVCVSPRASVNTEASASGSADKPSMNDFRWKAQRLDLRVNANLFFREALL